jgi:hypothetical protein
VTSQTYTLAYRFQHGSKDTSEPGRRKHTGLLEADACTPAHIHITPLTKPSSSISSCFEYPFASKAPSSSAFDRASKAPSYNDFWFMPIQCSRVVHVLCQYLSQVSKTQWSSIWLGTISSIVCSYSPKDVCSEADLSCNTCICCEPYLSSSICSEPDRSCYIWLYAGGSWLGVGLWEGVAGRIWKCCVAAS